MRILLVHKFLRPGGGAEQVALNQWRWLEAAGHQIIPFGMRHPDNVRNPYARHWAPRVDYDRPTPGQLINLIWSQPAAEALQPLVAESQPQVALLHNIYHQLSPSILPVLHRAGIPVALMAHDYKLVCPNYRLFTRGAPCTRCVGSGTWHAIRHRCVKASLAASALAALESAAHRRLRAYRHVERFIAPSSFVSRMLARGGFPAAKISVLPHAVEVPAPRPESPASRGEAFLIAGRLEPEKGAAHILAVARRLPQARFEVAGAGSEEMRLRAAAPDNVVFLGQLTQAQLAARRARAVAELVPSLWYEPFGLSALEAMAAGIPVVASSVGGLADLVRHDESGLLLPPGDVAAWSDALARLWFAPNQASALGAQARRQVISHHSHRDYVPRLTALLDELSTVMAEEVVN
jgi:glycosyltransferase involved in cell wall biosynthesis